VVDSNTSQTSHTPAKVLVVDDDVDNGLLLKDFLEISGFDVDVYFSSEEASKNFESRQYSDITCADGWYRRNGAIQDNVKN
jgi:DNA-binding response OmpR family regulator